MKQYLSITFHILLFALLTACGSNPNTSPDAGSLTFNIKLARPATAYQTAYLTGNDICIDYGVATVTAVVKDSSWESIGKYWGHVLNYQFPLLLVFLTIMG